MKKIELYVRTVTIKKNNNNNLNQNENTASHQQPKIDNINIIKRTLILGPSFSGKTHLMLKILSRPRDQEIYIIMKSPPKQYSNSKIKIKEIGEGMKPLNEYQNAIIVFDDVLGSSNSR